MATRNVSVLITGDSAQLKAALGEADAAADETAANMAAASEEGAGAASGSFSKLSEKLEALPFVGPAVKKLKQDLSDAGSSGDKFKTVMSAVGGASLLAFGAATVGIGVESIHMATSWQSSMTTLVTGAGEAQKNIGLVSKGILGMAGAVGQAPEKLAAGMYLIESAGYHGAQGLDVLRASAEGASVGNAQMSTVADAVTTALTDYHLKASNAAEVTSALVETVASGKTTMEALGQSLGKVMPQASALGINFQTVTGAMATMTDTGLSARLASQHLSNTLLALSAPSATAAKAMQSVGLTAQQLKDMIANPSIGLAGALEVIEKHVGQTFPAGSVAGVTALKAITGGATGFSTALMLTGSHAKDFAANVTNIGSRLADASTKVQGFTKVQGDLAFQEQQAKATLDSVAIEIGQELLPVVHTAIADFGKFAEWMIKNKVVAEALGAVIATVLGAAIGVFVYGKATAFASSLKTMVTGLGDFALKIVQTAGTTEVAEDAMATSAESSAAATDAAIGSTGIGAVLIGLGLAIALLATHWHQVWDAIQDVVTDAFHFVKSHLDDFALALGPAAPMLAGLIFLGTHWHDVWNDIKAVVAAVWSAIKPIFDAIGDGISAITKGLGTVGNLASKVGNTAHSVLTLGGLLAGGGPAQAGTAYIVGENGPEWFIPSTSGVVVPNNMVAAAAATTAAARPRR